jgi:excisionase family DNA binding protein
MLTVKEAAARRRVHPSLILRWLRQDRIPGAVRFGRAWMVPDDVQVLDWRPRKKKVDR